MNIRRYVVTLILLAVAVTAQAQVRLVQVAPRGSNPAVCRNPDKKKVADPVRLAAAAPLLKNPANELIIYYCPSDTPAPGCSQFRVPPWRAVVRCDGNAKGVCYAPPIRLQDPRAVSLYFLPLIFDKASRRELTPLVKPLTVTWEDKGEDCPTQTPQEEGFRLQLCVNTQCCTARNNDEVKMDITLPLTAGASPALQITSNSHGYPTSEYAITIQGNSVRRSQTCPNASTCDWSLPGLATPPPSEGFEAGLAWNGSGERIRFEGGKGALADGARCIITVYYR